LRCPPDIRPLLKLSQGYVVHEAGETIRYPYFPRDGRERWKTGRDDHLRVQYALGLVSAFASSKSNGRYIVQISGNAVRIEPNRTHEPGHGLRTL
jgi:hypothetical protein